jgi:hypothetical protein
LSTPRPRHGKDDDYRPVNNRRRLLIALLAVATALTVVWSLLERPGGVQWKPRPPAPDKARCAEGQTADCVGGKADVIMLPAPAASAPR